MSGRTTRSMSRHRTDDEIAELKSQLKLADEEIAALTSKIETSQAEIKSAATSAILAKEESEKEITKLRAAITTALTEGEKLRMKERDTADEINLLQDTNEALVMEVKKKGTEISNLKGLLLAEEEEHDRTKKENKVQENTENTDKQVAELTALVEKLESERDAALAKAQRQDEPTSGKRDPRIFELETQVTRLQVEKEIMQGQLEITRQLCMDANRELRQGKNYECSNRHDRPRVFSIGTTNLPTFGEKTGATSMSAINSFLTQLGRYFSQRNAELELEGNDGWVTHAIMQLRGDSAVNWANQRYPRDTLKVSWDDFSNAMRAEFIPPNALSKLRVEWDQLRIGRSEKVSTFNTRFNALRAQLDPYSPLSQAQLLEAYEVKLMTNFEAAQIHSQTTYRQMGGATLRDIMQQVADMDDKRLGLTAKGSLKQMEDQKAKGKKRKEGSTDAGNKLRSTDAFDGCYLCGKEGHIARKCPARDEHMRALKKDREREEERKKKEEKDRQRKIGMSSNSWRKKQGQLKLTDGRKDEREVKEVDGEGFVEELSSSSDDDSICYEGKGKGRC